MNKFSLTLEERQFLIHVIACLKTFVPDQHYHWTLKALNVLQSEDCPKPETIDIAIPTSVKPKEIQLPNLPK